MTTEQSKDMSEHKLLPCPFCGEKPSKTERFDEDLVSHDIVKWQGVRCTNCGISFDMPENYDDSAVRQWNTRSNSSIRNTALEEAAKVCDILFVSSGGAPYIRAAARQLSEEIRVLKSSPSTVVSEKYETAWLVEKGVNGTPEYITASEFSLTWTTDVNKALRLARRADAEAITELCDDAWDVVEHAWQSPSGKYLARVAALSALNDGGGNG